LISDPLFYLVAVPAVLLAAISKGGFGGGLAMLGVPTMALFVDARAAAAIMLPILCVMDLFSVRAYWGKWDPWNMRILIPAAVIGIVIGALTFRWFDEAVLRLLIGFIAVVFTLDNWIRRDARAAEGRPSRAKGTFWGALAAYTSFLAHAGGPPANAFLLPQRLHKTTFVATLVGTFTFINYSKLLPYWWLGQFPEGNLRTSLVLLPLAPIGIAIGVRLHDRIPTKLFYRLCYGFLFATGLKLIYDGLVRLM
jgi:uncharacterized protein